MNPEIKEKWVAALRSGEYGQDTICLRSDENSYCCLGVLTDLYNKETGKGEWNRITYDDDSVSVFFFNDDDYSVSQFPHGPVYDWSGLHYNDGGVLASMNDGGQSFEEIAEYIDTNL